MRCVYARSAEEDVKRRDFTINGLLLNPENDEVLDYVGGRDDLAPESFAPSARPEERFREDKLQNASRGALRRAIRLCDRARNLARDSEARARNCFRFRRSVCAMN